MKITDLVTGTSGQCERDRLKAWLRQHPDDVFTTAQLREAEAPGSAEPHKLPPAWRARLEDSRSYVHGVPETIAIVKALPKAKRMLKEGADVDAVAKKTGVPAEVVAAIRDSAAEKTEEPEG